MAETRRKPTKPYPSFPLTAHPNGQWCKKIRSKVYFFGVWADPEAALQRYHSLAGDLHAGREPRPSTLSAELVTVKDVCIAFLGWQKDKMDSEEIGPRWFEDCRRIAADFAQSVGKSRSVDDLRPEDFQRYRAGLANSLGLHALSRHITVVRGIFKQAYETDVIEAPMKFGKGLTKPSAAQKRKAKQKSELANGKNLMTPEEIVRIIRACSSQLLGPVMLGINGGLVSTPYATRFAHGRMKRTISMRSTGSWGTRFRG